jgi:hypothetical protein
MQQWQLGLGQNSHGEHIIDRGKSYELVAEADSSQSVPKISTKSQRSELDSKGGNLIWR